MNTEELVNTWWAESEYNDEFNGGIVDTGRD